MMFWYLKNSLQRGLGATTLLCCCAIAFAQNGADPAYTAHYRLNFEADWSAQTHPGGFPPNPHFSSLIGGVHNAAAVVWRNGETASPGIEAMAETGATFILSHEVETLIDQELALAVVQGPGIGDSPGSAAVEFDLNADFPMISITSMIAPSPDWFVAVDSLDLRDGDGWREQMSVELYLYDAGSDSGSSYTAPNDDTQPKEPIALITHAPFDNGVAVGRFVFTLMESGGFFPLSGHHSGLYSDPNRDGEGINLSVAEFADRWAVTVTWFTYLDGEQMWLVGSADFEPGADEISVDLYVTSGAEFGDDFNADDVIVSYWGSVTLRIPECGSLDADYESADGMESGSVNLQQLVPIGQLTCE